jgi:hypothetical protein
MTTLPPNYRNVGSAQLEKRVGVPMELRCGPCGRAALYPIGRVCLDPSRVDPGRPETVDDAFGFTGYFHCQSCGAGGPWQLTTSSRRLLDLLMREATADPENARLVPARLVLFDGTTSRWPTQGEAHLKSLLEKEPDGAFLWNRLGNLYATGDADELAIAAFGEALKRDPHQIEAMHSLGEIYAELGDDEQSAKWFHQMLLHARHAPAYVSAEMVRGLVDDALWDLARLHHDSDRRIPMFPKGAEGVPSDGAILEASQNAPSKEEGRQRVIDLWVGDRAPRAQQTAAPHTMTPRQTPHPRRPTAARRPTGRNDPCPCGSGKKYKSCCGRS